MDRTLRQKVWSELARAFPERQIYIRSDGRVQFFAFDPLMQAICAGAALVVLGWVAFASVNVIFKDRIIEAKERHFVAMQQAYESRIADLQISYDELNGALVAAEDRFEAAADSLETKEKALADVIERKQALQVSLGIDIQAPIRGTTRGLPASAPALRSSKPQYLGMNMGMGGILEQIVPNLSHSLMVSSINGTGPLQALSASSAVPTMLPQEAMTAPLSTQRPTFLEGAVRRLGEFFGRKPIVAEVDHPLVRRITQVEARVATLDETNPRLASEAKADIDKETARLKKIARTAGVDPGTISARVKGGGQGGPLLPIGVSSQVPASAYPLGGGIAAAQASLADFDDLVAGFKTLPLSLPFDEASITSGFGGRSDPFTENFGYHTGLDLSGPLGTDVRVTAPGVVVYAARAGDYGNMVEIDHGNGIHTRYAHLMKIKVPVGARLEKDDVVGELGSTGRSTGPHVHYEVWYDNVVRDPQRLIKAGRDVLKTQ